MTAKVKSPTKVTPIDILIMIALFIAKFSPHLEVYRTEKKDYLTLENKNVYF
tara:strand:- start:267 stop:422 length:156 start_codon:yes stop_codon:yes gene_type:complete